MSIRQPYVEEILRGLKRVEYRSQPTRIIGKRLYIYAALRWASAKDAQRYCKRRWTPGTLPTGVILGTAIIERCEPTADGYARRLADVARLKHPLRPRNKPQPAWFRPFGV